MTEEKIKEITSLCYLLNPNNSKEEKETAIEKVLSTRGTLVHKPALNNIIIYYRKENEQLKAQIEKMKMCCNCAKWRSWKEELDDVSYPCVRHDCDSKCSLWKLKE